MEKMGFKLDGNPFTYAGSSTYNYMCPGGLVNHVTILNGRVVRLAFQSCFFELGSLGAAEFVQRLSAAYSLDWKRSSDSLGPTLVAYNAARERFTQSAHPFSGRIFLSVENDSPGKF